MPKSGSVRKGEIQLSVMCQSNARRLLSRDDECPQTSIVHKCPQIANVNPFCLLCPLMAIAAIEPRIKGSVPMGSDPLFPCGVRPYGHRGEGSPQWGQTMCPKGSDLMSSRPSKILSASYSHFVLSFPMWQSPQWGQTLYPRWVRCGVRPYGYRAGQGTERGGRMLI